MIVGSLLMIPCHLAMGLTMIYPVYPMILLGFAFVLVPAAMWPSVPLIVRSERVGTAFGLMTAIQNVGLGLFPWLNGMLRDKTGNVSRARSCLRAWVLSGSCSPSCSNGPTDVRTGAWKFPTKSRPEAGPFVRKTHRMGRPL